MRKAILLLFLVSVFACGQCAQWLFNPYTGKLDCAATGTLIAGPPGASSAGYAVSFSGQTTQTISAATLTAAGVTTPVAVDCVPGVLDVLIDGSNNVTIKTGGSIAYTGTCTITGGGPATAGGPPTGAASGDLSGSYPSPAVAKVNGTSVPTITSADRVLGTTASATGSWLTMPVCLDSAGKHLNYDTSTHLFSCGTSSSGSGTPGGSSGDIQVNTSGAFAKATAQQVCAAFMPKFSYCVGNGGFASIRDAYLQCATDIGVGIAGGTCEIWDYNLPETMNVLPWKADHTEHISVILHLGPGKLTVCDTGTGTDGQTCSTPFSLATGNGGAIMGVNTGIAIASNSGTRIVAGAAMSTTGGLGLITLGDSSGVTTGVFAFGAKLERVIVDCNAVANLAGVKVNDPEERAEVRFNHFQNCHGPSIWQTSPSATNMSFYMNDVNANSGFSSATIPVVIANSGSPRMFDGLTIFGQPDATSANNITLVGATYVWNNPNVTITLAGGTTFNASTDGLPGRIAVNQGPNSTASFVGINGVTNAWNVSWQVIAVGGGGCPTACSTITLGATADPGALTVGSTSVMYVVPTFGALVCAGSRCATFAPYDTSVGGQVVHLSGWHMEHVGTGIYVTSNTDQGFVIDLPSCTATVPTCIDFANDATLRYGIVRGMNSIPPLTNILDEITGRTITTEYLGYYMTGTAAATKSGLAEYGVPFIGVQRATPGNGQCITGTTDCLFASTSNYWMMINNGGAAQKVTGSGADINTSDQVTATHLAAALPLAQGGTANTTGLATNLSGTPALPNGTTATTQSQADASTKLATTAYVDTGLGTKGAGTVTTVSGSGPAWLTWAVATATTTPAITLSATTGQTSHQVIGTCGSGTTFAPCALVAGDIPTLNQNTSGTAANLSGTPALPSGTTATTQSQADGSTKLATTAYVDTGLATKAASTTTAIMAGVCNAAVTNLGTNWFIGLGSASTACAGSAENGKVPVGAHTVLNLHARPGTTGTTGGGVVTVRKNASDQTLTCTLSNAASCADLTHTFTTVDGDQLSVSLKSAGGTLTTGPTYSSGASACTNGTQVVTFTNGTSGVAPVNATGTITVSGNVPTGVVTVTGAGAGYTAATPPTNGTVATCTGTAVFTGGAVTVDALASIAVSIELK